MSAPAGAELQPAHKVIPCGPNCVAADSRGRQWAPCANSAESAALVLVVLIAGCASFRPGLPVPPELTQDGVSARVLIPPDLNINPTETVVKPDAQSQASAKSLLPPELGRAERDSRFRMPSPLPCRTTPGCGRPAPTSHGRRARSKSPSPPSCRKSISWGSTASSPPPLLRAYPANEGFLLPNGIGTRSYAQTEVGLEWTLYDFGRTGGRYRQAVARERITELQLARATRPWSSTWPTAYLDVLLARASRRVQEDAVRRAEAILDDTEARRKEGVALKDDVLRAEVQLSESREALVLAREGEYDAVARLNNAMGRNAGLPLEVVDLESQPPLPGALAGAPGAGRRPSARRSRVARQAVVAAQEGRQAARGEFLPRIFVRAAAGHTDGENVITGWQEGAGLHVDAPLYAGGRHRGELRPAEADIEAALADAQTILDAISLQVNLAYRGVVANQERVGLARPAVEQSAEALRIVRQRYRAGTATPTDVIDAETAATRAEQRYVSARIEYLSALARVAYVMGGDPESLSLPPNGPGQDGGVVSSFEVIRNGVTHKTKGAGAIAGIRAPRVRLPRWAA